MWRPTWRSEALDGSNATSTQLELRFLDENEHMTDVAFQNFAVGADALFRTALCEFPTGTTLTSGPQKWYHSQEALEDVAGYADYVRGLADADARVAYPIHAASAFQLFYTDPIQSLLSVED